MYVCVGERRMMIRFDSPSISGRPPQKLLATGYVVTRSKEPTSKNQLAMTGNTSKASATQRCRHNSTIGSRLFASRI